jgi:CubicO group peptidase (beta-lactamase class C family)
LNPKTIAAIDQAMRGAVAERRIAGGVVEVSEHGRVVLRRAYGFADLETATPAAPDDVFRVGSLTKQFTAAAVLRLVEMHKLGLDDAVAKYLPQFPRGDPTTIHELLTHTAGLADYVTRADFPTETLAPHTTDQLVAYVLAARPLHVFAPGTAWAYSSSNYVLAGAIVERVSCMPLGRFLQTQFFGPLGMTATALDSELEVVPHRVAGYDRTADGRFANAAPISLTVPFAAGALRSTAHDLLVWENALAHSRVLDPSMFREMSTTARLADGALPTGTAPNGSRQPVSYGMGLFVGGEAAHPDLWHDGAINGFTSHLGLFGRSDMVVAVLVNTSPNAGVPVAAIIAAMQADPANAAPTNPAGIPGERH